MPAATGALVGAIPVLFAVAVAPTTMLLGDPTILGTLLPTDTTTLFAEDRAELAEVGREATEELALARLELTKA